MPTRAPACPAVRLATRLLVVALAATTALTGCTSSTPTTGASPGGAATPSGTAGASTLTAAGLATRLGTALDALSSAHLVVDAGELGGTSTAEVALHDGRATASDVHLTKGGKQVEQLTVGASSWVKIPGTTGGPWVRVSATSTNPIAKSLATGISVTPFLASLGVITALARSATDLTSAGAEQVDGAPTTHVRMKVNPKKVTGAPQLAGMLALLGSAPIPVDLWLDATSRPVKFVIHVALGNAKFPITVRVSGFDAPVSITAPPAGQISGG